LTSKMNRYPTVKHEMDRILRLTRRTAFKKPDERLANFELILTLMVEKLDEQEQRVEELESRVSMLLRFVKKLEKRAET